MKRHSNVFRELLKRGDGIHCLLKEYELNELNVKRLNEFGLDEPDETVKKELFFCEFVDEYGGYKFDNDDKAEYERIYREKKITYDRIADEDLRKRFSTKLSIKMVEEWQQQDAYERLMMQEADNAGSEDTFDAETDNHQEKSWNPECLYLLVCFMAICFVIMVHRGIHHGR